MSTEAQEQAFDAAPAEPEVIAPVEAEQPAQAAPQAELSREDIENLSSEEIQQYLYEGKALEIPDKPKAAEEPEVEKTPATEEQPEQTQEEAQPAAPAAKAPEVPANLDEPLPGRITTKQFASDEQKAMRLQHVLNEGKQPGDPGFVSLWDAKAKLDEMESGKAATPPVQTPSPVETISSEVAELETNLKALRQQRQEAITNGEDPGDIETQIDDARDAVTQAKVNLALAQERAKNQQAQDAAAQANKAQSALSSVQAEVEKEFPTVKDSSTPLGSEVAAVIAEFKNPNHADHSLLGSTNAPRHVVREALDRIAKKESISLAQAVLKYGVQPAATIAPKAVVKPATPPVRKVLPASGAQATTPPKGPRSNEEILADVGDDDSERAIEALFGNNKLSYIR